MPVQTTRNDLVLGLLTSPRAEDVRRGASDMLSTYVQDLSIRGERAAERCERLMEENTQLKVRVAALDGAEEASLYLDWLFEVCAILGAAAVVLGAMLPPGGWPQLFAILMGVLVSLVTSSVRLIRAHHNKKKSRN